MFGRRWDVCKVSNYSTLDLKLGVISLSWTNEISTPSDENLPDTSTTLTSIFQLLVSSW